MRSIKRKINFGRIKILAIILFTILTVTIINFSSPGIIILDIFFVTVLAALVSLVSSFFLNFKIAWAIFAYIFLQLLINYIIGFQILNSILLISIIIILYNILS